MGETIEEIVAGDGHELVVLCSDPSAGYRAVIALHSTALGPALGGARLWAYPTFDDALTDALRLSRGMTYKNALAGLPFGGGKAVIFDGGGASPEERERLFRAHGRFVERLGGRYITAEDVGTSPADMEHVLRETAHVGGLLDRSGDPSPATARGVFRAIQASVKHRFGADDLAGLTVALQGCGHVGHHLARELSAAGARLVVSDVSRERAARTAGEFGARVVAPEEIYDVEAEVFAPCALGGVLNDETLPRLKVGVVAGAANNQLLEARHGDELAARGILYAPDYVANSGGVINGCRELLGWPAARSRRKIEELYDTLLAIFRRAESDGVSTARAADRLAEARLARRAPRRELNLNPDPKETTKTMPELRGKQATEDVKKEWVRAYEIYRQAPGDPYDKKNDRTERIGYVAEKMKLTRKQAKRRVRNYEAWQRNIKKGLVPA